MVASMDSPMEISYVPVKEKKRKKKLIIFLKFNTLLKNGKE